MTYSCPCSVYSAPVAHGDRFSVAEARGRENLLVHHTTPQANGRCKQA